MSLPIRAALLFGLAGLILAAGLWVSQRAGPERADLASSPQEPAAKVVITMAGFNPALLEVPAGQPVNLLLVNPDSPYHTDGGGVHGFTVPAAGLDVRVAPRSRRWVRLPPLTAGDYPFYCDTCCGGKENPAMQGVLRVKA